VKDIFLIDADDTLLDFPRSERAALTKTLSERGLPVSDEVVARYHEINDEYWKKLERGEITREQLQIGRFQTLLDELKLTADVKAISEEYFEALSHFAFYLDGAEDFLKELKKRGRIFIVTNGAKQSQPRRMRVSGLDEIADGIFISGVIGLNKPSLEYARYVETHIENYDRSRAVWIGDSLSSDKVCAERAGIDFILYCPDGKPQAYDGVRAESYRELLGIL